MKQLFILLSGTLLIGAGCAGTQTPPARTPQPAAVVQPAPAENNPPTEVELGINPGGITTNLPVSEPLSVTLESGNFFFKPDTITAKPGQKINVAVSANSGFHTFVIDSIHLKESIKADGTFSFNAPSDPGSYEFYCDVGSHKAMGMKGTLIVK